jgi:MFS family permease
MNILKRDKNIFYLYLLVGGVFGAQSLEALPSSAITFYLKETLGMSPSQLMYVSTIISLVWLVKMVYGYFIDQFLSPKFWMIFSIIGSLGISIYFGINQIIALPLLIGLLFFNSWTEALRSTGAGGIICGEGKTHNITGKLASIRTGSEVVASILTGIAGGWIAQNASYHFGYICLIPIYLILLIIVCLYKSPEKESDCLKCLNAATCPKYVFSRDIVHSCHTHAMGIKPTFAETIKSYKSVFANKQFLFICLFLFLYQYSPSFGTPLFYVERDSFKWSRMFFGILDSICAAVSISGIIFYFKFSKKLDMKKWITSFVFIGACTALAYLYFTPVSAIIYSIVFSIMGMLISLIVLDFMAQSSIKGKEAVSFAVLCSVTNLAGTCSTLSGAWLFPRIGLAPLILISSITSFMCLPLIPRIFKK